MLITSLVREKKMSEGRRNRPKNVPEWQYQAFKRWLLPSKDATEAKAIKRLAESQAGER